MHSIHAVVLLCALGCSSQRADTAPSDSAAADTAVDAFSDSSELPAYPAPPYGLSVGHVFPNVTFDGYRMGKGPLTKISIGEYFDPTGARGVNGIALNYTATGACGPCLGLGPIYQKAWSTGPDDFARRGARLLDVLAVSYPSATIREAEIETWVKRFKTTYDIALDPQLDDAGTHAPPFDALEGYPTLWVIDPRTMVVTHTQIGVKPMEVALPGLSVLLTKNGAPPDSDASVVDGGAD